MRWHKFGYVLAAPIFYACSSDGILHSVLTGPRDLRIVEIRALPSNPLGALVRHQAKGPSQIRVTYAATDNSETGFTPWQSPDSSVAVLGLAAGRIYTMQLQSLTGEQPTDGPIFEYQVPPLPTPLAQVSIKVTGTFSGGYSMAPIKADGHGYLIIFDSLGTIRWYRDFGKQGVAATTQQEDGNITAFVGGSNGLNPSSGVYVEVTSSGDSVRIVTAVGSPYTDPHELLESSIRRDIGELTTSSATTFASSIGRLSAAVPPTPLPSIRYFG